MSLKRYSERSSLRENTKQVSEFSRTATCTTSWTSHCSLTSVLHSGMSLKHYSERSSLGANMKQVSEFAITSHRQVPSKVQTLRYDARRRKVIRHSWSSFNKNKSKTQPQPTSSMPLGFWPFTEHEKLPQKYRHSNTTPARAKWIGTADHHLKNKIENSTSANIVNAIRILGFHWA